MSSLSPAGKDGIRHRRTSSQKLNPLLRKITFPAGTTGDGRPSSALAASPRSSSSQRVDELPLTGLALSPAERDILVLSTAIKTLLFPA